jgi:hypothetical protein
MLTDSLSPRPLGLLLALALLTVGCAGPMPPPGRGRTLNYTPHVDTERAKAVGPSSAREAAGGSLSQGTAGPGPQSATLTRRAILDAVNEVSGSTDDVASSLSLLEGPQSGLSTRANGIFSRYVSYGGSQLPWLRDALGGAMTLVGAAAEVQDPDMELGLLRLTGPRLQAAMSGTMLLAAWLDFLNLADAVLRQCPPCSVERLYVDMDRVQKRIEPSMRALSSLELDQVEATAAAMPELMGQLTQEFHSIREQARVATERSGQLMAAAQFIEMLTLISSLKMSLPRLPPVAPVPVGVGLVMGSNGVMMGSRLVVTAEWMEMMRRLVQAGVISVSAASAAVRIHAGQVLMSQANQGLPQGVRDALGDGPEVRAMHETGRTGAGMAEIKSR